MRIRWFCAEISKKNSTDFTEIPVNLNVWQINFWIQGQIRIY